MTDTTDTQGRQPALRARHDEVVAMLAQGLTRSQMAVELGVSTNTVIGYVYRHVSLEVAQTRRRKVAPAPVKPKIERRGGSRFKLTAKAERQGALRFGKAVILEGPRPPPSASAAKVEAFLRHVPAGPGVAFLDLERGDNKCRWPVPGTSGAAMVCCGAQTEPGESYCKECHRVGWTPRVREVK